MSGEEMPVLTPAVISLFVGLGLEVSTAVLALRWPCSSAVVISMYPLALAGITVAFVGAAYPVWRRQRNAGDGPLLAGLHSAMVGAVIASPVAALTYFWVLNAMAGGDCQF